MESGFIKLDFPTDLPTLVDLKEVGRVKEAVQLATGLRAEQVLQVVKGEMGYVIRLETSIDLESLKVEPTLLVRLILVRPPFCFPP